MNSRERVWAAIKHQEPDRVPVDIGGSIVSGIMAGALARLHAHLGMGDQPVKVYDQFQMLGEVTLDLVERLDLDILPVEPPSISFNLRNADFKPWTLFDGTEVLVPGAFDVTVNADGDWLMHDGGDSHKSVLGHMPKDGFYFDRTDVSGWDFDYQPPPVEQLRREGWRRLREDDLRFMQERAQFLREHTDKALVLTNWSDAIIGPGQVGSVPEWLVVLVSEPEYVQELMALADEVALDNLKRYWEALGDTIDIFHIDGIDFGSQHREMFSPQLFERYYVPSYKAQCGWIHAHTPWKVAKHCCGSITQLIKPMMDAGIDVLNPVQTSATGMDPRWLKTTFGDRLTFWGGGVDTQRVLPFGTPEEVYKHVTERVRIFAPGGGFIWAAVHNIQYDVPPENVVAALQAVRDHGQYPIATA